MIGLPVTGGWQSWQTTTTQVILDAGIYTLKMKVLKSGFNLNWFEFEFLSSLSVADSKNNTISIFPNPVSDQFQVNLNNQQKILNLKILDVNGRIVKKIKPNLSRNTYQLSNLKAGIYFLLLETDKGRLEKKIIKM